MTFRVASILWYWHGHSYPLALSKRPRAVNHRSSLSRRSEVWVVNESADNYHFNFIFVKPWYFVFDVLWFWQQWRFFMLLFYRDIDQIFLAQPKHVPLINEGGVKKQPFNWIFPGSGYIACSLIGLYQTSVPSLVMKTSVCLVIWNK